MVQLNFKYIIMYNMKLYYERKSKLLVFLKMKFMWVLDDCNVKKKKKKVKN